MRHYFRGLPFQAQAGDMLVFELFAPARAWHILFVSLVACAAYNHLPSTETHQEIVTIQWQQARHPSLTTPEKQTHMAFQVLSHQ